MFALLLQNLRHVIRTRLLFFLFLFSFLIQYVGVKLVHSATVYFNGVISTIDQKDALFVALVFQLFMGTFLAAVYGIWMVPYLHQGPRSSLTFSLPVAKWKFPLGYALCMLALLIFQHLAMLASFGLNYGWAIFSLAKFPWTSLRECLLLETAAFEALTFGFAFCSMILGAVPTFFLGGLVLFLLQVAGVLFRVNVGQYIEGGGIESYSLAERIYRFLPPVGELVVDLRREFQTPSFQNGHLLLWMAWLLLFMLLFLWKLRYPSSARQSE
jgi:hypothetical protein